MGAGNMSFQELAQREELKTGGLSMGTHLCQYHSDVMSYEQVSTCKRSKVTKDIEVSKGLGGKLLETWWSH